MSTHIIIIIISDEKTTQQTFDITELLVDKPGALLSLLKVVDSVEVSPTIKLL
jgi:hypothetical protein